MPAVDDYATLATGLDGPFSNQTIVTPSDTVDLTDETRAVYIGAAGALKVTTAGGQTIVIPSGILAVGVPHPMRVTRIWSTGSTATPVVAVW